MNVLQTLMTRAYREKLNGPKQDVSSMASATIRIRLPEGLVLQGEFSAGADLHLLVTLLSIHLTCPAWLQADSLLILTPAYEADVAGSKVLDRLCLAHSTCI